MVSKKVVKVVPILKFNPEWFSDPVPPFKNLGAKVLKDLAAAKKDFAVRVNEIIAKGQR
jgi:hypothetical protein